MVWMFFTLFAAFMQAWRNAFQKQLSATVDSFGTTFARFAFALPLTWLYLMFLYWQYPIHSVSSTTSMTWQLLGGLPLPRFTDMYWLFIVIAGASQILATIFMVMLFKQRNYAIGIGLAKSEAVLAAIIGVIAFAEHLTIWGWVGVIIGGIAVFLLSKSPNKADLSIKTLMIGIASGFCFALASLFARQASLELVYLPFLHRAAWVLCSIIGLQWIAMLGYAICFHRAVLWTMWRQVGLVLKISLCSFLGSLGWFTAMSMQTVAVVKTLGQIEVLFSLLVSIFFLKEKLHSANHIGLLLVVVAAIFVIWA